MKNKNSDTPLQVAIENDQIVIRYGVDRNAFCALAKNGGPLPENVRVVDKEQFAKDVIIALVYEDEIGATMLSDVIDKAISNAYYGGSGAVTILNGKPKVL